MPEDLYSPLLALPPESVVLFLMIAALRPVGLMFGFTAFYWGFGSSMVVRISVGLAIGLPMTLAATDQVIGVIVRKDLFEMLVVLAKEVVLGLCIGLLASLPFFALKAGGEIIDSFRGETDSGHADPVGESISTLGTVFLLLGFSLFFSTGGLWQLGAILYRSYAIWPVFAPLPALAEGSGVLAADLLWQMLALAVLVAAPLMLLLFATEGILILAARLAQKFNLGQNEFLAKNLLVVLILPLIVLYVTQVIELRLPESLSALKLLQGFLR